MVMERLQIFFKFTQLVKYNKGKVSDENLSSVWNVIIEITFIIWCQLKH